MEPDKQMALEAYLRFSDLRAQVLDGKATQEEREAYFDVLGRTIMDYVTAVATMGMESGLCPHESEVAADVLVGTECILAIGMGMPGPMVKSVLIDGPTS